MSLTTQQQTDLESWKKDQSQPLPESLKSILIYDCFHWIENNPTQFNKSQNYFLIIKGDKIDFLSSYPDKSSKILLIQILLSRTPDGQAVMPFLDVESPEYRQTLNALNEYQPRVRTLEQYKQLGKMDYQFCIATKTLDHLLYREFTEALRTGKTFDEALEIINKTYILNIYV